MSVTLSEMIYRTSGQMHVMQNVIAEQQELWLFTLMKHLQIVSATNAPQHSNTNMQMIATQNVMFVESQEKLIMLGRTIVTLTAISAAQRVKLLITLILMLTASVIPAV